MQQQEPSAFAIKIRNRAIALITIASLVRMVLALTLELGNDEVYYWTYALYPDWSHFDHPPVVGWVAQIFSLNLFLEDDFFLRLGSIVLSAGSAWFLYKLVSKIKNELAAFYAVCLFTASIYFSIIAGFSFIPDAPLIFFWVLGLNAAFDFLPAQKISVIEKRKILWFGAIAGLAMISKYQGAFLWIGVFLYALLYNRRWLTQPSFYLSGIISAFFLLPLLIWNYQNDFISFTFHGDRVAPSYGVRLDYFFAELGGQMVYCNPVVFVLIVIALIAFFKKNDFLTKEYTQLIWLFALPLWMVFTGFSLFRSTLPHWTAPAYLTLLILAASFFAQKNQDRKFSEQKLIGFNQIIFPVYFLAVLLAAALYLIDFSPFQLGKKNNQQTFGEDDFTQDLYGWKQVGKAFEKISSREEAAHSMRPGADLISNKWFPGAHIDFYVAHPQKRNTYLIGPLNDIHKYAWINRQRGGLKKGEDYYHISVSNLYKNPNELFGSYFEKIVPIDTVVITRAGVPMRYAFFYELKNYNGTFADPLPTHE
jgi:hypothetical protein